MIIAVPQIFNSDQGSQFTSLAFIEPLEKRNIQISMEQKGRAMDNIFTEGLWRTMKYEEVYLNDYATVSETREGLGNYMDFYNQETPHQSLNHRTPAAVFFDIDDQNKETSRYLKQGNFVS